MTIRVPGAGDASLTGKGQAGDLHVRVSVASSKIFRRQGVNLHHDIRIPLQTALLGGKVRVPTLDGEVDVRIPGGTQPGEEMVLKGRGVKSVLSSSKGDLFVSFQVQLPRSAEAYTNISHHSHLYVCVVDPLRRSNERSYSSMLTTLKDELHQPRILERKTKPRGKSRGRQRRARHTRLLRMKMVRFLLVSAQPQ